MLKLRSTTLLLPTYYVGYFVPTVCMIASPPLPNEVDYAQRSNVIERGHIKRSFQNTDELRIFISSPRVHGVVIP